MNDHLTSSTDRSESLSEAGWFLPYEAVKHLTSLPDLLAHAKRAHYTNATVRKDGKETVYEADWIKHMRWVPTWRCHDCCGLGCVTCNDTGSLPAA